MSRLGLLDSIWELGTVPLPQDRENSPLHTFAKENDWEAMEEFLQNCDPKKVTEYIESRNDAGSTPLHIAAYYGNAEALQVLQKYNAHGHYRNKTGWSAHNYAARWSQPLNLRMTVGLLQQNPKKSSSAFSFRAVRDKRESLEAGKREVAAVGQLPQPAVQLRQGGPKRAQTRSVRYSGQTTDSVGLKHEDRLKSDSGISVFDSKEVLNCP